MTAGEVAERLGVHPNTVGRWLKSGKLSGVMIGRERAIPVAEVEEIERARLAVFRDDVNLEMQATRERIIGAINEEIDRLSALVGRLRYVAGYFREPDGPGADG